MSIKLDAQESAFFARQLELIKSKSYDVKYAELKYRKLVPMTSEQDPGAEKVTYRQYDMTGSAKIISNHANDLPRARVKAKEFSAEVKTLGSSFTYTIHEVRAAAKAGKNLVDAEALAVRRAVSQLENKIGLLGDADSGLQGFFTHPNIGSVVIPDPGSGTEWVNKTPDQIISDMNLMVNSVTTQSLGVETADTLLLPLSQFNYVASTARSANSDTTILQYFMNNNPYVKNVEWVNELDGLDSGDDVAIAYRRDPEVLQANVMSDYEQLEPQAKNLSFVVPCFERFGGTEIHYPLAVTKGSGI